VPITITQTDLTVPISDLEKRSLDENVRFKHISELKTTDPEFQRYRLNEFMGYLLRQCWEKSGKGKLNIFQSQVVDDEKTYCRICYKVDYAEEIKNIYPQGTAKAFMDYLKNTPHPNPKVVNPDGTRMSMHKYLDPYDKSTLFESAFDYSTQSTMLVVFERQNVRQLRRLYDFLGPNSIVGKAEESKSAVRLMKIDELSECDEIVN
jgi:hypothetical protein